MIWWFPYQDIFPVFRFFPDFSGFSLNLQISSQNGWFTSHLWYDDFLFRKLISFHIFFWIFPDFQKIFRYILFLRLLCSRSRTLRILSLVFMEKADIPFIDSFNIIKSAQLSCDWGNLVTLWSVKPSALRAPVYAANLWQQCIT